MGGGQAGQAIPPLTSLEICAGAGGQALGLHNAGYVHRALVEWDSHAVRTLSENVKGWPGWGPKRAGDLKPFDVRDYPDSRELKELKLEQGELDLLAGGVPCPPFSLAGKRLGEDDERDLFPAMLEIVERLRPKALMIENVRGILEPPHVFVAYRRKIINILHDFGYRVPEIKATWSVETQNAAMGKVWRRIDAGNFGVPQLRPRAILVAIRDDVLADAEFVWPQGTASGFVTVHDALQDSMRKRFKPFWNQKFQVGQVAMTGKEAFQRWERLAAAAASRSADGFSGVAPTLVGGSRKHGGADLGPSRAKKAWLSLGIDAMGVANDASEVVPERDLFRPDGPMLTVEQAALIQGFPKSWKFQGGKTARYRQVGNAFPPPVAEAVGRAIAAVLRPQSREANLRNYVMENEGAPAENRDQEQLAAFALGGVPELLPVGDDRSRNYVSA
jgi:DNA (cytosine-5)-methyltransferase 1